MSFFFLKVKYTPSGAEAISSGFKAQTSVDRSPTLQNNTKIVYAMRSSCAASNILSISSIETGFTASSLDRNFATYL